MKAIPRIGAAMLGLALLAAPAAGQGARTSSRDSMTISRQGTRPARRGPEATLIVTAGTGRILRRGGPVEEIRAGDVIWTPPGVEHWHGASPETAMQHIAIQESLDRKVVDWLEHVTDEQYRGDRVALTRRRAWRRRTRPLRAPRAPRAIVAALAPITAVVLVAYLIIGRSMPVLPLHVHRQLGLGTFLVGVAAGVEFAAGLSHGLALGGPRSAGRVISWVGTALWAAYGAGAHSVVEAVGTQEAMMQALHSARAGGHVGFVGVPRGMHFPGIDLLFSAVHLHGGPAPVSNYLPTLLVP